MTLSPTWVIDTSSIIEVRRCQNAQKAAIFHGMSELVNAERLVFPPEVLAELQRRADPDNPDAQYRWARLNAPSAVANAKCSFEEVAQVLAVVPQVLDPDKDSGVEEGDPYVLAAAFRLRAAGIDARVVTEERHDTPKKMSMSTAAGVLGIPSVPLHAFLSAERIS